MDLNLNHKVSIVAVDSTAIITKKNGSVDLLFLKEHFNLILNNKTNRKMARKMVQ